MNPKEKKRNDDEKAKEAAERTARRAKVKRLLHKNGVTDESLAETLIDEFDLADLDDEKPLAREVARKVRDRVESYAKLLENLLQPDTNLATMNECSFFNETEYPTLTKSYRKLMSLTRAYTSADVEATKESYNAFIKKGLATWQAERDFLQKVAAKLEAGWQRSEPLQREREYFG